MRGQGDIHNQPTVPRRGKPERENPAAEVVCVELWITPADDEGEEVSLRVRAYGYDGALRNDYEIVEASAETLAEPFSLDLLRRPLSRELADAVAGELEIAYRERPTRPPPA